MASKIILVLSKMSKDPRAFSFRCPDEKKVTGIQTNEAPVKYLQSLDRNISQILCLLTPTAKATAFPHFQKAITATAPKVSLQTIDAPDNGQLPDETMAALLKYLQKGDTVYLDSSGGTRNTVMGLMQLVRILEYKGIKLKRIVNANINDGKSPTIDDVTDLYQTMNLIGGMQELSNFGSIDTLMRHYKGDTSPDGHRIINLLTAIEKMTDAITLCRLEKLEQAMTAYQEAMTDAQNIQNPIMQELLDIFRSKFGTKITIPWVIRWCLEHRMLSQALSIYREWMPKYLLRESGLFTAVPTLKGRFADRQRANRYQDENVFLWDQFINLSQPEYEEDFNIKYIIWTLSDLNRHLPNSGFQVRDTQKAAQAGWDLLYAQVLRNMVLHSNESAHINDRLRQALEDRGYPVNFASMEVSDFLSALKRAVARAEQL